MDSGTSKLLDPRRIPSTSTGYGSVTFTDAQTIIDDITYYIYGAPSFDDIVMLQGARIISAVTSPVTSGSPDTFTVTYKP
ncbi:MAG: hypothetical protein ACUVTD_09475 [Nitrososphaerales archaeon]